MTSPLFQEETPRGAPESNVVERLHALDAFLRGFQFRYTSEVQLHEGLESVLEQGGFEFSREKVLGDDSRVDFWLDGIVLEVKVAGSYSSALGQVHRYARKDDVAGVLLASTKRWAVSESDRCFEVANTPIVLCHLQRKVF